MAPYILTSNRPLHNCVTWPCQSQKMVIVRNRYQKWKEHVEISKIFNFQVTDVKVWHFIVILMFQKLQGLKGKKAAGWQALPSSMQIYYNCPNILHSNVGGLKIGNPANFMMPPPFQPSISNHNHLLWLTRSRDNVMQRAYYPCASASVLV